jgi:glycogen operon protein
MSEQDWAAGFARSMMVFLNGETIQGRDPHGERIVDDSFLCLFNAHHGKLDFTLMDEQWGQRWLKVLDTATPLLGLTHEEFKAAARVRLEARSLVVFRRLG